MNIALLHRLRQADGQHLPMDCLGQDGESVSRDLERLEAFGFEIERHPLLGVAYRGPAERLCPDQIEWELGTERIGRRITVWNRVTSTNDLAARAASSAANDGLVVLAEEQTAGRGRQGRSWHAPARTSILMSVLLFPPPELNTPEWLTALGAVSVAGLVHGATGREARIKWPNDVRVDGRKVSGVLVERNASTVLGIGINVNTEQSSVPAELRDKTCSLRELAGMRLDRSELVRLLLRELDSHYSMGLSLGSEPLRALWRDYLEERQEVSRGHESR